jgi:outer membrane protein insertion porin family
MLKAQLKILILNILFFACFFLNTTAEIIKKIDIIGNERVSNETIKVFINITEGTDIKKNDLNVILKSLYETNFFDDIELNINNNILTVKVKELPLIQNINFKNIKSSKIIKLISKNSLIREKSSFNEILLKKEKERIKLVLKNLGYYSSDLEILIEDFDNNLIDLTFDIKLGEKARISKITFIGDKVFKDSKLKRVITSSEYKFWKIISGKKFLNENIVSFDKRLLKNFYLNNGYYNVEINHSFAKLLNKNNFELIFNINAYEKVYFDKMTFNIPDDFNKKNFEELNLLFKDLEGKTYSINAIEKILDEIDKITLIEQYKFIDASVSENLVSNKMNLDFSIKSTEKFYIKRINIFGNNVTKENVIRNQLEFTEGDPYNEILISKSVNNLKSLGYFASVNSNILDDDDNFKVLNLTIQEKPTGEIFASAGVGTDGSSIGFGIKEKNFLGDGINLDTNISLSTNSFKGKFSVVNPNFQNSDKSLRLSVEATETDNYELFGYKTNKTGFKVGTNYEFLDDLFLGIGTSNFYEKIETNSTASKRQQEQEGDYWDTFISLDFDYDKRNQKFQTTDGFRSYYSTDLPIISESNTLKNYYQITHYFDLFEKNISTIGLYLQSSNSLSNKDIKLSERINIPSSKLRGFKSGGVGPKDGDDFIGGNYAYSLNFSSTLPHIMEESQNVDMLFFIDVANVWGVDYDSSLNDSGDIRSATGLGLDWYSPIGPMNFSLSYPLSKASSDETESFRFNLGTTF